MRSSDLLAITVAFDGGTATAGLNREEMAGEEDPAESGIAFAIEVEAVSAFE